MGMAWCVDVEVKAVLRHGNGQHCEIQFFSNNTHYIEVLWTPEITQSDISAGSMQWPKPEPGSLILSFALLCDAAHS